VLNPEKKSETKLEIINFTDQEKEIIELIKKFGLEDTRVKKIFIQWVDESEKEAEKEKNFTLALIMFLRQLAYLYLAAGLGEKFEVAFNDVMEYAWQMKFDNVYNLLNEEFEEIKSKGLIYKN